jgi:hypothetical protein
MKAQFISLSEFDKELSIEARNLNIMQHSNNSEFKTLAECEAIDRNWS